MSRESEMIRAGSWKDNVKDEGKTRAREVRSL